MKSHAFIILLLALVGCSDSKNSDPELSLGEPLNARPVSDSETLFTRLTPESCGLDFVNPLDTDHPLKRLYAGGYAVGGIAIGDVNGDGRPDVYCVSGPSSNRLFLQTSNLTFEDSTFASGLAGTSRAWGTGVAMVDIDNDRDLDIYVCRYDSPNALFINDGTGHFSEDAKAFGVDVTSASLMPSFVDYDNDGDLDLYVVTNLFYREHGMPKDATFMVGNEPKIKSEYSKWVDIRTAGKSLTHQRYELFPVGQRDVLLRNDNGVFKDVSGYAGDICVDPGKGLSATWWDYNEDGFLDLYVCNDFEDSDRFYHNNGDGTFKDMIKTAVPHSPWYSMGSDIADFNQDGKLDLFALDMAATSHFKQKTSMGDMSSKQVFMETAEPRQVMRNSLFLNTGTARFQESAYLAGLASSDWSWAAKAADFDNDSLVDLFVTNGMSRAFTNSDILKTIQYSMRFGKTDWELFADKPAQREANLAFVNRGDLRFEETANSWGLGHVGMSYSAAYGDLDGDGDLDLVVGNLDEPVHLYRNDLQEGHRLLIELRGTRGHSSGTGARIIARAGSTTFVRQANPYTGFLSSNEPTIHIGLGEIDQLDELEVHWPSGIVQRLKNVPADQRLVVEEAGEVPKSRADRAFTMFARTERFSTLRHRERPYDDFARQPLLPNKLSQLGPGLAMADVDGDGAADLFLGGAAGFAGQLQLHSGKTMTSPFEADQESEDIAAAFFDANGDGHTDLFVVSGGVECEPGDVVLRDRLYLGDGKGGFVRHVQELPDLRHSGGSVAVSDFDQDGDMDLFVGGRTIPGRYPLAPESHLLVNESGAFEDRPLRGAGMVTDALWSDVDGDGWQDLLIAHEWGPVRVYSNREGQLEESEITGVQELLGWWSAIAAGDIDHDGDVDYAIMNTGLNTKYHASREQPALLYYGDFENTGRMRLVEAEFEDETLFPIRGKSCSTNAMPHLANKFHTYQDFAAASLETIYLPEQLSSAHRFEANTLESGLLINDGKGSFTFRTLPRLAQIAPGRDVALTDFDGDGNLDLYMLQNFYTPQLETGRMDGGVSQLLKGDGKGGFTLVSPAESGLVVSGDAAALVVTDLNDDGKPDIVAAQNDGPVMTFLNQAR
jgi:enediyne biosynthesis protein E4